MTTIAFDGKTLVADTLASDDWGLESQARKLVESTAWVAGFAGRSAQQYKWAKEARECLSIDDVLAYGYPTYEKDKDDPAIILICRNTKKIWRHSEGIFIAHYGRFFAIGSGRDYALMAMHLGLTAIRAISEVAKFDIHTNDVIDEVEV